MVGFDCLPEESVFRFLIQVMVVDDDLGGFLINLSMLAPSFEVMGIVIIDPIGGTHSGLLSSVSVFFLS